MIPARYKQVQERRVVKEASEDIEIIPERYAWVKEDVVVKEASTRLREIPAEYEWAQDRVMTAAPRTTLVRVPATYKYVEDRVLVKEAYTAWKKGRGPNERIDGATGEIMCLVEHPAEYKTIRRRVLDMPARVEEHVTPAKYETVRRRVLAQPARIEEIAVPAEYKTMRVRKVVSPAREVTRQVPAEYETVSRNIEVSGSRMEWQRVLCETNATPEVITTIQTALQRRGYYPGRGGRLDARTYAAIHKFQADHDLLTGALTYETIRELGVRLP